jgi:Beta-lactamase enzyme family
MSRQVPDPARPSRAGTIAVAVAVVGVVLGGLAAFATTIGGAAAHPTAAQGLEAPGASAGSVRAAGTGRSPSSGAGTAGRHADPFSAAMTSYLAGRAGTVVAAVYDRRTGQTWTLGHGQPQATASIVKVDILETLLANNPDGLSAADQALAQSMIENSDNDAATALWNAADGPAGLGSYNASIGLRQTTPSACLVCPGFPWPGWGLTTTTPADQVLLLRQLFAGPQLSRADRDYAKSLMENVEPGQRWGVSAGVPTGVRVALKDGWVPLTAPDSDWQVNSEGWISGDGRDYLVAVLATGSPSEQYGIDTISNVSASLWTAMG